MRSIKLQAFLAIVCSLAYFSSSYSLPPRPKETKAAELKRAMESGRITRDVATATAREVAPATSQIDPALRAQLVEAATEAVEEAQYEKQAEIAAARQAADVAARQAAARGVVGAPVVVPPADLSPERQALMQVLQAAGTPAAQAQFQQRQQQQDDLVGEQKKVARAAGDAAGQAARNALFLSATHDAPPVPDAMHNDPAAPDVNFTNAIRKFVTALSYQPALALLDENNYATALQQYNAAVAGTPAQAQALLGVWNQLKVLLAQLQPATIIPALTTICTQNHPAAQLYELDAAEFQILKDNPQIMFHVFGRYFDAGPLLQAIQRGAAQLNGLAASWDQPNQKMTIDWFSIARKLNNALSRQDFPPAAPYTDFIRDQLLLLLTPGAAADKLTQAEFNLFIESYVILEQGVQVYIQDFDLGFDIMEALAPAAQDTQEKRALVALLEGWKAEKIKNKIVAALPANRNANAIRGALRPYMPGGNNLDKLTDAMHVYLVAHPEIFIKAYNEKYPGHPIDAFDLQPLFASFNAAGVGNAHTRGQIQALGAALQRYMGIARDQLKLSAAPAAGQQRFIPPLPAAIVDANAQEIINKLIAALATGRLKDQANADLDETNYVAARVAYNRDHAALLAAQAVATAAAPVQQGVIDAEANAKANLWTELQTLVAHVAPAQISDALNAICAAAGGPADPQLQVAAAALLQGDPEVLSQIFGPDIDLTALLVAMAAQGAKAPTFTQVLNAWNGAQKDKVTEHELARKMRAVLDPQAATLRGARGAGDQPTQGQIDAIKAALCLLFPIQAVLPVDLTKLTQAENTYFEAHPEVLEKVLKGYFSQAWQMTFETVDALWLPAIGGLAGNALKAVMEQHLIKKIKDKVSAALTPVRDANQAAANVVNALTVFLPTAAYDAQKLTVRERAFIGSYPYLLFLPPYNTAHRNNINDLTPIAAALAGAGAVPAQADLVAIGNAWQQFLSIGHTSPDVPDDFVPAALNAQAAGYKTTIQCLVAALSYQLNLLAANQALTQQLRDAERDYVTALQAFLKPQNPGPLGAVWTALQNLFTQLPPANIVAALTAIHPVAGVPVGPVAPGQPIPLSVAERALLDANPQIMYQVCGDNVDLPQVIAALTALAPDPTGLVAAWALAHAKAQIDGRNAARKLNVALDALIRVADPGPVNAFPDAAVKVVLLGLFQAGTLTADDVAALKANPTILMDKLQLTTEAEIATPELQALQYPGAGVGLPPADPHQASVNGLIDGVIKTMIQNKIRAVLTPLAAPAVYAAATVADAIMNNLLPHDGVGNKLHQAEYELLKTHHEYFIEIHNAVFQANQIQNVAGLAPLAEAMAGIAAGGAFGIGGAAGHAATQALGLAWLRKSLAAQIGAVGNAAAQGAQLVVDLANLNGAAALTLPQLQQMQQRLQQRQAALLDAPRVVALEQPLIAQILALGDARAQGALAADLVHLQADVLLPAPQMEAQLAAIVARIAARNALLATRLSVTRTAPDLLPDIMAKPADYQAVVTKLINALATKIGAANLDENAYIDALKAYTDLAAAAPGKAAALRGVWNVMRLLLKRIPADQIAAALLDIHPAVAPGAPIPAAKLDVNQRGVLEQNPEIMYQVLGRYFDMAPVLAALAVAPAAAVPLPAPVPAAAPADPTGLLATWKPVGQVDPHAQIITHNAAIKLNTALQAQRPGQGVAKPAWPAAAAAWPAAPLPTAAAIHAAITTLLPVAPNTVGKLTQAEWDALKVNFGLLKRELQYIATGDITSDLLTRLKAVPAVGDQVAINGYLDACIAIIIQGKIKQTLQAHADEVAAGTAYNVKPLIGDAPIIAAMMHSMSTGNATAEKKLTAAEYALLLNANPLKYFIPVHDQLFPVANHIQNIAGLLNIANGLAAAGANIMQDSQDARALGTAWQALIALDVKLAVAVAAQQAVVIARGAPNNAWVAADVQATLLALYTAVNANALDVAQKALLALHPEMFEKAVKAQWQAFPLAVKADATALKYPAPAAGDQGTVNVLLDAWVVLLP